MPVLSRFYGIVIRMYFQQAEHNPPHVHVLHGDNRAEVDIKSGEILEGNLSPRVLAMVKEWIKIHEKELLQMWATQEFKKLSPLE